MTAYPAVSPPGRARPIPGESPGYRSPCDVAGMEGEVWERAADHGPQRGDVASGFGFVPLARRVAHGGVRVVRHLQRIPLRP